MSYHIIEITSEGVVLSVKNRQLLCKAKDGSERSLPMEDIGAVVINSFSTLLHNSFLSAAGEQKAPVVICERFKPKSIVLPVQRGGDTLLTRAQICAPPRLICALWKKTVNAKVMNQLALAEWLSPDHPCLPDFRAMVKRDDVSKEGNCARLYWEVLSSVLNQPDFRRNPEDDGLNSLLNYSYGVLLSRVLQRLLAVGLDPMYGVGHAVRERAAPLAYDVMEPFRPAFDLAVVEWVKDHLGSANSLSVNPAFKMMAQNVFKARYAYCLRGRLALEDALDLVVKSMRESFLTGKITRYRPWMWKNSVWDG